jgi:hypothetical protein
LINVYLVPVGKERFELYAEAPEESPLDPPPGRGALQRWVHEAGIQWHALVDAARRGQEKGRLAGWRDAVVRRMAETIAEQRTLWALRGRSSAMLFFPAMLNETSAQAALRAALAHGRRHHGRWLIVDGVLFLASGILAIVPGPNLIAYYFLFRLVGHLQSWRGARDGMARIAWRVEASQSLAELAALVDVPRAVRASRVAAIAAHLNVPRLSVFFDRAAVPSS